MKLSFIGFVGSKLREAREARSMTGAELADRIGQTRQAVSSYESGDSSPQPIVLRDISQILNVPIDFFVVDDEQEDIEETPIFYRSLSSATKSARKRSQIRFKWFRNKIVPYVSKFIELPTVNFPNFNLPIFPEELSTEKIEETAIKMRRFWGLGNGPISNLVWLLENNGVIVARHHLKATALDAFSQWVNNKPYIILNNEKISAARSRFNAAHELGHLVLHKNSPKPYYNIPEFFKMMESQAHRFAAAFLFPREAFLKEVSFPEINYFISLKPRWKVSIKMMIFRSKELGLLSESEANSLFVKYSRQGFNKKEPLDDELEVEVPKLIKSSIEALISNSIQDRSEILLNIKLASQEIEELIGLDYNYLGNEPSEIYDISFRINEKVESKNQNIDKSPTKILTFPQRSRNPNA